MFFIIKLFSHPSFHHLFFSICLLNDDCSLNLIYFDNRHFYCIYRHSTPVLHELCWLCQIPSGHAVLLLHSWSDHRIPD